MASSHEQRIQRYLAAHPGATRQQARGHGRTGEHGVTKTTLAAGELIYTVRQDRLVARALSAAAREGGDGARVTVTIIAKDGTASDLFQGRGYTVAGLQAHLRAAGGNWREALLAATAGSVYEAMVEELFAEGNIGEFQFIVI